MKKYLVFILILTMFFVVGCGSASSNDTGSANNTGNEVSIDAVSVEEISEEQMAAYEFERKYYKQIDAAIAKCGNASPDFNSLVVNRVVVANGQYTGLAIYVDSSYGVYCYLPAYNMGNSSKVDNENYGYAVKNATGNLLMEERIGENFYSKDKNVSASSEFAFILDIDDYATNGGAYASYMK